MGRVLDVETNSIGEVTAAHVMKGNTRERVYRHATSLIFLLPSECLWQEVSANEESADSPPVSRKRSSRLAAQACNKKLRALRA